MSDQLAGGGGSRPPANGDAASLDFETRTRTELLEVARARQVPDADLMRRDELIAVLRKSSSSHALAGKPALESLSRGELLQMAHERNIAGGGTMSRAALVVALATHAEEPTGAPRRPGRGMQPAGARLPQTQASGPAPAGRSMPAPEVGLVVAAGGGARSGDHVRVEGRRPSSPPSRGTNGGRTRAIAASLPPGRVLIPGVLVCLAMLGAGVAAASEMGGTTGATTHTSVYTTTVSGRIITVKGKANKVLVPAKTIHRNGKTVTIPAHTVAITDTQLVPGPTRTVDGTVIRTVRVPVTVTGPGTTVTTTQTVTGPVTTVVQTVISTTIDTTTVTVTETVTSPPTT
jgi:hypothetical protein